MLEVFILRFLTGFGVTLGTISGLIIVILGVVYWKSSRGEEQKW